LSGYEPEDELVGKYFIGEENILTVNEVYYEEYGVYYLKFNFISLQETFELTRAWVD
jgi:hypothetical protein